MCLVWLLGSCVLVDSLDDGSDCVYTLLMGYSIIVLSGVCDVESENHSKITGCMTSGE